MSENHVRELTSLMRTSDRSFWKAFRKRIREKGLAPERTFLAVSWPDDSHLEVGYLVTQGGEVIWFEAWSGPIVLRGIERGFAVGRDGKAVPGPLENPVPDRQIDAEDAFLEVWETHDAEDVSKTHPEVATALGMVRNDR